MKTEIEMLREELDLLRKHMTEQIEVLREEIDELRGEAK